MVAFAGSLEAIVRSLSLPLAGIGILALILFLVVIAAGRALDLEATAGLQEFPPLIFFGVVMMSFGATYLADRHVRVETLRDRGSPRLIAAIELIGCAAVLIPLSLVMIWAGTTSAWQSFLQGEGLLETSNLPLKWIVAAFVPAGFLLLLLAALAVIIRNVSFLRGGSAHAPAPDQRRHV